MSDILAAPRLVARPEDRIKALVEKANDVTADDSIPIKRYWASAKQMLRMANVYLDEKNLEKCFILYMKYIILFIEQLPKHSEYKLADPSEKAVVKNNCTKIIPLAEEVKSKIKTRYEREFEAYTKEKQLYDEKVNARKVQQQAKLEEKNKIQTDNFVANFQLELDRKKRELAENKEKPSRFLATEESQLISDESGLHSDESNLTEEDDSSPSSSESAISPSHLAGGGSKPQVDRTTKPALHDACREALSELIVPFKSIVDRFLNLANSNTSRNVETCAILAGQLKRNRFTITHLMVPKQSGTSETCCANNEEELAIEQERLQLITLGWIHTHPSQRSFLSSVDLHTHAPYQKMLPEAIAIVVAPIANEIGTYSLTEYGLDYILRCRQKGFHPHPNEQGLYGEARHTIIDNNLSVQVVDFR